MSASNFLHIQNEQAFEHSACPKTTFEKFRQTIIGNVAQGARLSALLVCPEEDSETLSMLAVLANPHSGDLGVLACDMVEDAYTALTPDCPAAHWFEREIAEQWGIRPEGHPWLKPIRFQPPRRPSAISSPPIGVTNFFHMNGEEVHEVAVGPVHAGVIEPGHFRFQCQGETVHHLEISLGYQHRGVERSMATGPDAKTLHYAETLSGDTTIGHATAYCHAVESLSGTAVSARAYAIRAVAAELERLANHVGDLGALAGDIGFLPTMSYCGRIRGDVLNMTALLCGNRFGRGLVVPGGVAYDVDASTAEELLRRMSEFEKDITTAVELMFKTPSVLARLENTGEVPESLAREIGLVGVAARASGIHCDIRHEFPYGLYRFKHIPLCTWPTGDCFARAYVRWFEIRQSIMFVCEQLHSLPVSPTRQIIGAMKPRSMVATLVEGWRGEICHVAATNAAGRFLWYKVVDPSFHNWFGLACSLRQQQISDFPLCNKSFNLSYCGHDL